MELNSQIITTAPLDSASVVLLRDGSAGLEVFLLRRHGQSDVLGGAYVFPGGKLDAADHDLIGHLDQPAAGLHAALGEPALTHQAAAALYVAALREAFEESGVLLAHDLDADGQARAQALLRQGRPLGAILSQLGLRLSTDTLAPWSRWITPRLASVTRKRFDTRFFVAAAPAGQTARHDDMETTDSVWLTPRAALTQYWDGRIALAPPQIMSLAHLARHTDVAGVLREARNRLPPLIEPEPFEDNGMRVLTYPGDPRHSVPSRALPCPTRLYHRHQRFEPEGGFEGLFS